MYKLLIIKVTERYINEFRERLEKLLNRGWKIVSIGFDDGIWWTVVVLERN